MIELDISYNRFKIRCWQQRDGSSPSSATINISKTYQFRLIIKKSLHQNSLTDFLIFISI